MTEMMSKLAIMDAVERELGQRDPTEENIEAVRAELQYTNVEAFRAWEYHELKDTDTVLTLAQEMETLLDKHSGRAAFGMDDSNYQIQTDDGTGRGPQRNK